MFSLENPIDQVSLSQAGLKASAVGQLASQRDGGTASGNSNAATEQSSDSESGTKTTISAAGRELSAGDRRRIAELKRIDAEVRAHEQAHINAGRGVITSGPNYTYTYGPDGKQYATSGEVGIDTSPERKPEANIDKGQRIQDAALAPAQPSPQDYQVAATGSQLEAQGRSDLAAELRAQQVARAQEAEAQRQAQLEAQREQQAADAAAPSPAPDAAPIRLETNAAAERAQNENAATQARSANNQIQAYSNAAQAANSSTLSVFA